mgnify:CR=1 FL=1
MSKTVTIVLAGIGGYGDTYLGELLAAPPERNVQIAGAVDPQPERSPHLDEVRRRGIPLFPDLASFYAQAAADLTVISAPIHLHCPLTCLALSRGSSVLCEKPLCATVQEAAEMAEAEEKAGRFVAIGYQWSFSPAIQALKRDVMAGEFGRPVRLKTVLIWPRKKSYYNRSPWAGAMKSSDGRWVLDSPVNNATAHYLHNMFYILGDARDTSARLAEVRAELYRANPIENYDTAALRCRTESGAEILFYSTHAVSSAVGPLFRYEFEKGVIQYGPDHSEPIVARLHDGRIREYGDPNGDVFNKLWHSVESVRGGAPLACGIRAALPHTLCMNGAQDSVKAIAAFPAELVKVEEDPSGDSLTWVEGLQETFIQCYDEGILPAEHGVLKWARAGRTVSLRRYRFFPGGKPRRTTPL